MIKQFKQLNLGTKRLIVVLSFLLSFIPPSFEYNEEDMVLLYVISFLAIWLTIYVVLWIRDGYTQSKNNKNRVI